MLHSGGKLLSCEKDAQSKTQKNDFAFHFALYGVWTQIHVNTEHFPWTEPEIPASLISAWTQKFITW